MIGNSHGDRDEEKHQLRILLEHDVGGLVVRPCASSTIIAEIMHYDVPVVAVESPYPSDVDVARVDDAGGMQALTALLVEHGHRHIGLINGPINSAQTPRRQAGYRAGLEAAGIPFDATLVVNTNDYTPKDSMQKVHELLNHSEPPRALLAASAALAQGMLQALEQRNLRVPDDIEVAAYNDGYILPKGVSTATSEPVSRVGQEAAKMLIERIEGYTGPPREFVLPYQLTVGTPINRVPDTSSVSRHMGETTD
jgi:LacI family transcriptional regulator